MRFRKRAAKNSKVLRKNIHQSSMNGPVTCNYTIPGIDLLIKPELSRAMRYQHPDLLEASFIE
jgi:hypothetical protein